MSWVLFILLCNFCIGDQFGSITNSILNWYEFSPKSLNVDSCLGLRWAQAFDPENDRLKTLVKTCTETVAQTEPKYWKKTEFVFTLHWKPLETLDTRKMFQTRKYTKTRFNEDFTDECFAQIPDCRLSHECVRYIFAPPGRKYFVTHQLLLSLSYRTNCPHETMFWLDLKRNEKALCGSIHGEVWHKIELCDLRLEQVLLCGMAGFKGFVSQKWKTQLLQAVDKFKVKDHEFACIKHRTAGTPVNPLRIPIGRVRRSYKPRKILFGFRDREDSLSRRQRRPHRRRRRRHFKSKRTRRKKRRRGHPRRRHYKSKRTRKKKLLQDRSRRRHSRSKRTRKKKLNQDRSRRQPRSKRAPKTRGHRHSRRHPPKSKSPRKFKGHRKREPYVFEYDRGQSKVAPRKKHKRTTHRRRQRRPNRPPKVIQKPKKKRMGAREMLRRMRKFKDKEQRKKNKGTLLTLSYRGRRRLRSKTDEFGCDSHTTALLIANFLLATK